MRSGTRSDRSIFHSCRHMKARLVVYRFGRSLKEGSGACDETESESTGIRSRSDVVKAAADCPCARVVKKIAAGTIINL